MNKLLFVLSLFISCSLLTTLALALPDDRFQEITIEGGLGGEGDMNLGQFILRGSLEDPVIITQGSIKITGLEVTVERIDGSIHKITVKGQPAQFQQQPEVEQGVLYASGLELTFNNTDQLLTIDKEAKLTQAGNSMTGCHVDYNLESATFNMSACNGGERLKMVIPPGTIQ